MRRFHEAHKGENRFLAEADRLFFRRSVAQEELHVVPWASEGGVKIGVFLVATKTQRELHILFLYISKDDEDLRNCWC